MKKPLLIIISGPSCTGKSTLAKRISDKFLIPAISKDGIKETIFDNLGWSDREWSKIVGKTSSKLLMYLLNILMTAKNPIMIESNFNIELDTQPIIKMIQKHEYFPIQIMCKCEGQVLFERFKNRSESGERHPGHNDNKNYDEFKEMLLKGKLEPMNINGKTIEFDTTNLNDLNYDIIFSEIESKLI